VDGRRDVDLRDPEHADGDCFPGSHEMDHQRRRTRESTRQIAAANRACGDRISFAARVQCAAHHRKQHV
jgi:hypothetical protein